MKNGRILKVITSITLAVAMLFSSSVIVRPGTALAAKTVLNEKTVKIKYNSHADSRYNYSAQAIIYNLIDNPKKNATYTVSIKNKKVAKVGTNKFEELKNNKKVIYSTGTGTTTGTVYEKIGKKKNKLGTIKIKVTGMKMKDAVDNNVEFSEELVPHTILFQPYMDINKIDFGYVIQNELLNSKYVGVSFKKSDYSVKYSLDYSKYDPDDPEAEQPPVTDDEKFASVDENGIITLIKDEIPEYVNADLRYKITFSDKSKFSYNTAIDLNKESSIKTEDKYTLDNIRDYVIGLDTPVPHNYTAEDIPVPEPHNNYGPDAPLVNFDNASTTPELTPVRDAIEEEKLVYSSIGRGFSWKSNHCTEVYNNTRDKVLDFLSADHSKYTCFYVNSTTDGLNKLASALITSKNDIVLTTRIEHHANDLSWRNRCKCMYAEVDEKGRVKYDDIKKILKAQKGKVKLVSISAASNVTGYVSKVHDVAKLAHKYGAMLVVDGAQIVAHRKFSMIGDVDDPTDDVDFISFSAHKMYSPEGGGAVVGITKELNRHLPTFYGGGTVRIVDDENVSYKDAPATYEAGSPDYPAVVGLGKAIEVLSDIGFDAIQEHEYKLNRKIIDAIKAMPHSILYGDSEKIDDRVGVVTFNFDDINSELLAGCLSNGAGVATRRGIFCAHPYCFRLMGIDTKTAVEAYENCSGMKTPGMIRTSFGIYNTEAEIDKLIEALPKAREDALTLYARPEYIEADPAY
ncbi:MAG: aminotransferase class V-fold PLP-dependent enzyme [Eubacterium sp.]|nr:aminotransferase class V-fold PLP-dependent enzyme [Eubacterium sp.]